MTTAAEFLNQVATPIVDELRAIDGLKSFTTNTEVIEAHAEATVRRLVRRMISPLRVCTGAVVSEELCADPGKLPQLDAIVWQPCPAPALFEVEGFGIVPRSSAIAFLEIKRSAYSQVGSKLKKLLSDTSVRRLVADDPPGWVSSSDALRYPDFPAIGVICVRESGKTDKELTELESQGRVVVLLEKSGTTISANSEAVWRLVNFLIRARQRALAWDGRALANIAALRTGQTEA